MTSPRRLARETLPADTTALARHLIGITLVHDTPGGRTSGRIVETEAYPPGDASAHHFRGPTPRNRSLYLRPGHAYVYFIYGTSYLFNVSSESEGTGGGVLLRALEPLEGVPLMQARRATERLIDLTRGPGRLTVAMGIGRGHDGADLCMHGTLWLGEAVRRRSAIGRSVRIGISVETHRLLRFYERGNPFVSGPKKLNT